MRLVTFRHQCHTGLGIFHNGKVYPLDRIDPAFPAHDMVAFLEAGPSMMELAKSYDHRIKSGEFSDIAIPSDYDLLAPVPRPVSARDAYAFRQHVAAARRNRGVDMIPEFDQFPVFYFTNHLGIVGPGPVRMMPDHFERLDFELEVAVVIGRKGRNIRAHEADDYIAGYMIMNDFSARRLQMEEMKLSLGPAKGKDFATAIGPYLVTPDELEDRKRPAKEGHTGTRYDLVMKAYVNGQQVSEGNLADMDWTFAEIIERISYGTTIYPGEVIGSGTVGTGCFMELNGTWRRENPDHTDWWLQPGDEVVLEVERLGTLTNQVIQEDTDYSILALKKNV